MTRFGDIEETVLPGVGVRYDLVTEGGVRLGVVVRACGDRELLIGDRDDPDAARCVALSEHDLVRLGEILGMAAEHG